jgi:rare lipoprotein A (peptidoglycan hydrolase)
MQKKVFSYMPQGTASWYAYQKCLCAASPDFPKGTRLRVRSTANPSNFVVVRINDWGPERDKHPERVIDLDAVAFKKLAPLGAGVIGVTVEPLLPTDPDYSLADQRENVVPPIKVITKPMVVVDPEKVWNY